MPKAPGSFLYPWRSFKVSENIFIKFYKKLLTKEKYSL